MLRPTYPRYRNGGWNAKPGSCNSGFRSCPSKGGTARRVNGLEVNRIKAKNATPIAACTPSTRARSVGGSDWPNHAAQAPNSATISTHSSMDPSWFPHVPLILYSIGLAECEFSTTSRSEKSDTMKAYISAAKAKPVSRNCSVAAGSATAIQPVQRLCAPTSGTTVCTMATRKARMRAK